MPISIRIDPAQKVVYTLLEGAITDQQFLQHAGNLASRPEIDDSFVELIHADTSSMVGVTGAGLREIAAALKVFSAIRKIGIVASRDVEFGLARMVEFLADESPMEIQVFREEAEAKSWLGVE